jgi:hypothetical protein
VPAQTSVFGFPVTSTNSGITDYTPVSQGPVAGSGGTGDPLTQVTKFNAGSLAQITRRPHT